MNICSIIAEYNPFHNGHLYHLDETRKLTQADYVIAVMSGHFTQRGLPCFLDKYTRTKMALACGIDLVIELPVPYATGSAQRFAEASISLLKQLNCVNSICFGSESGDLTALSKVAKILYKEPEALSDLIYKNLQKGLSYPRSRHLALQDFFKEPELLEGLESPNNILALEYLRGLFKYNAKITPFTICRKTAGFHDQNVSSSIASATAIRTQFTKDGLEAIKVALPPPAFDYLKATPFVAPNPEDLWPLLQYKLMTTSLEDCYGIFDIPKNLCNTFYHAFKKSTTLEEFINHCVSKTYTRATVQRSLLRLILNIQNEAMLSLEAINWVPYVRILGCKKASLPLLSYLTKHSTLPIITNLGRTYSQLDSSSQLLLQYETLATQLYAMLLKKPSDYNRDYTEPFLIL